MFIEVPLFQDTFPIVKNVLVAPLYRCLTVSSEPRAFFCLNKTDGVLRRYQGG